MSGRQLSNDTLCPLILNVLLTLIHCLYREAQWTDRRCHVLTLHILLLALFYHLQHNRPVRLVIRSPRAVYLNACHKNSLFDTDMKHKEMKNVDRWFSPPLLSLNAIKFVKSYFVRTYTVNHMRIYRSCHDPHCDCDGTINKLRLGRIKENYFVLLDFIGHDNNIIIPFFYSN